MSYFCKMNANNNNKEETEIYSFSAGPVLGPDGQKLSGPNGETMMYVNDKIYTEKEGKKMLEAEAERLWKALYGEACKYCDFAPCVLNTPPGKKLLEEGKVMQQYGDFFHTDQFLRDSFMALIHDQFERNNPSEGLPECVTCAITSVASTSKSDEHVSVPSFAGFLDHAETADGKAGFTDLKNDNKSKSSSSSCSSSDGSSHYEEWKGMVDAQAKKIGNTNVHAPDCFCELCKEFKAYRDMKSDKAETSSSGGRSGSSSGSSGCKIQQRPVQKPAIGALYLPRLCDTASVALEENQENFVEDCGCGWGEDCGWVQQGRIKSDGSASKVNVCTWNPETQECACQWCKVWRPTAATDGGVEGMEGVENHD